MCGTEFGIARTRLGIAKYCTQKCFQEAKAAVALTIGQKLEAGVMRRGADDCWPWKLGRNGVGYGVLYASGRRGSQRKHYAHRLTFQLFRGEIPYRMEVCHHCDNPPCCNPAHLFLGTRKDNAADCKAKGRTRGTWRRGESHNMAKLTEHAVREIRQRYGAGERPVYAIARDYGISAAHASKIGRGGGWRSIL